MSVRFEPGARRAVGRAVIMAEGEGRHDTDGRHLVLALLEPAGSITERALDAIGAEPALVRRLLGPGADGQAAPLGASDANVLLERANEIAERLGDRSVTELSILIACAGDQEGAVGDVLRAAGVSPERIAGVYAMGRAQPPAGAKPATASGQSADGSTAVLTRSGIGYDSHRFAPGGPMVLGGVHVPSDVHLVGHSDGDAIAHAVTDAVLGAAGAGDIGEMFSDRDPANRGRDSMEMLRAAVERVRQRGFRVHQVDVTVIAEQPKIGPHRAAMRERLAQALGVRSDDVSVKGKTNEGMGWVGRGEGLACIAVATLAPTESGEGAERRDR